MEAATHSNVYIAEMKREVAMMGQMTAQTSQVSKTGEVSSPEEHRPAALDLYQKLYEMTPKFAYKSRIEELTKS